jgi:tripartite-type tricarboxylate transporter receptor subunit TctC
MGTRLGAALAAGIAIASLSTAAPAQDFPVKPVTLIAPFPAGGATDIVIRALAESTQKHLGQPIVVENKTGASGTLGPAQMAANAKPDGYTIAQIPITVFRIPFMTRATYDPANDFTFVFALTGYVFGVVFKSDSPWKTFDELLADAKANPGKIKYGTPGTGTSLHITMEQIAKARGIKWTQVPFKGSAETYPALLGGHVHAVAGGSDWGPLIASGDLRLLVTWSAERTKNWPHVPSLRELGFNLVANSPYGLAGPKGMDPKTVKILHDAFKKGSEDPAYRTVLARVDQEPAYLNTEDYAKHALAQIEEQRKLIEELGLKTQ